MREPCVIQVVAFNLRFTRIEAKLPDVDLVDDLRIGQALPVARKADVSAIRGRSRYRFKVPQQFSCLLIDRRAPEVHAATPVGSKI